MILAFLSACITTALLLVMLRPVAVNIGLVDRPNLRKTHAVEMPLIGGIAMVIGLALSSLLLPISLEIYRILFFVIGLLAIVGVLDDHQDIAPKTKFVAQFIAAIILVSGENISVHHIGDILNMGDPIYLSTFKYPLTIIAVVGVINAFNMVDGLDGLAGGLALTALLSISALLLLGGANDEMYLLLIVATVILTFLFFNVEWFLGQKRQVFMGDAGSMFIGLIVVYALLKASLGDKPPVRVTAAPWIIGLPLLDLIGVLVLRILKKSPVYLPDRLHIHHVLLDWGMGKSSVLFFLLTIQILFCMVGVFGSINFWPDVYMFWGAIGILGLYVLFRIRIPNKLEKNIFS